MDMNDKESFADSYIDDCIFVGLLSRADRIKYAASLIMHATFRDTDQSDDVPRDHSVQLRKFKAERTLAEKQIVLGWTIYTHLFRIILTKSKAKDWIDSITRLVNQLDVQTKEMETTIGRLNHAAHIIPLARYFLNLLRQVL